MQRDLQEGMGVVSQEDVCGLRSHVYIKPRRSSTDSHLRSLVQKAVRRGCPSVTRAALLLLQAHEDDRWIRSRSAVLSAEECWPLLASMERKASLDKRIEWIVDIARREKYKDAAGLGTLAYAASEDDQSVFDGSEDDSVIRVLAAGLRRPDDYWPWLMGEAEQIGLVRQVEAIRGFVSWPTWPWDKAFVHATALLAVREPGRQPKVVVTQDRAVEFPFWAAIDKHTDEGKTALRTLAKSVGCTYRQLNWVSYYFESAVVNLLGPSRWWAKERTWRLNKVGLSVNDAEDLWTRMRQQMSEMVFEPADQLRRKLLLPPGEQATLV